MFFFFDDNPYIAIIGDIIHSKEIEDRRTVQKQLKELLDEVNIEFSKDITSKFTITLGDEFQGLLSNGMNVMRIIQLIEQRMYPIRIRFGIGIGSITTDIDANMAIGADGPGYYKARDAIEYLKKQEKKRMISSSDVRFEVDSDNQGTTILLNTIADLMFTIKSSWSKRQRQVIWDLLIHQDSQKEVANRLKIAQPTVNKILTAGNYYVYKQALDTIGMAMEEIKPKNV